MEYQQAIEYFQNIPKMSMLKKYYSGTFPETNSCYQPTIYYGCLDVITKTEGSDSSDSDTGEFKIFYTNGVHDYIEFTYSYLINPQGEEEDRGINSQEIKIL